MDYRGNHKNLRHIETVYRNPIIVIRRICHLEVVVIILNNESVLLILGETKNCEIPEMIAQELIELKSQINKIIGESYNY